MAVKVWALDVLDRCRGRVAWVAETWDDLLETLAREATPGIACRVGRYRKAERQDTAIHPSPLPFQTDNALMFLTAN